MSREVAVWLEPLSYHLREDRLFDVRSTPRSGERILEPFVHLRDRLRAAGIDIHTADLLSEDTIAPAQLNLYVTMGIRRRYRSLAHRGDTVLSAFFVNECPIVEPRLFRTLDDAAPSFKRIYSFASAGAMEPFLSSKPVVRPYRYPYPFAAVDERAWSYRERGLLAIINANKVPRLQNAELYSERLRAVASFARWGEIDLYGAGWAGPPFRVGETWVPRGLRRLRYQAESGWDRVRPRRNTPLDVARTVYRGAVASKVDTLSRYTFSICFENMAMEGWVTEKIFDCLRAGTVPVYLGAPDIESWVWPECFVDMRRFASYDELRDFLRSLSPAEIEAYREAGRDYFSSDEFRPFTKEAFAEIFAGIVREDAGVEA